MTWQSVITSISIQKEMPFANNGSNSQHRSVSQASEMIDVQRRMVDVLGLSSNQSSVSSLEALRESFHLAALSAGYKSLSMDDSIFTNYIENAYSIWHHSRFNTLTTPGFQPMELHTTEYVTNPMDVIVDSPGVLYDQEST
jgi:hypothetical protein